MDLTDEKSGVPKVKAGYMEECKMVSRFAVTCLDVYSAFLSIRLTPVFITFMASLQVLVVRTDLKMDKGKIAAQCGCVLTCRTGSTRGTSTLTSRSLFLFRHATLACYKAMLKSNPDVSHLAFETSRPLSFAVHRRFS